MVAARETGSGEEELLEKICTRVAGIEVLRIVKGDIEGGVTGPLGAVYPDGGAIEG